MANSNTETLLMVFIGITAAAVLLQAGVLLGIYLTVRKAVQAGKEQADEYRAKLTPILESSSRIIDTSSELISAGKNLVTSTQTLVNDLTPELRAAARELSDMVTDVHMQTNRLQARVEEVTENVQATIDTMNVKARQQVERVDGMTTTVLNGVDRFGSFLNEAVNMPVRQVNGVIAAARAVIDALRTPAPRRPRPVSPRMRESEDKDLFV